MVFWYDNTLGLLFNVAFRSQKLYFKKKLTDVYEIPFMHSKL